MFWRKTRNTFEMQFPPLICHKKLHQIRPITLIISSGFSPPFFGSPGHYPHLGVWKVVISAAIENQHFRPFLTALRIGTLGGVFGKVPASWPETEKTVIICHFGVIPGVPTSFFWGFLGIMLIIPEFPGIPCAQNVHTRKSECANSRFRIPRRRKSAPIPTPRHPRHPPHPHTPPPPPRHSN